MKGIKTSSGPRGGRPQGHRAQRDALLQGGVSSRGGPQGPLTWVQPVGARVVQSGQVAAPHGEPEPSIHTPPATHAHRAPARTHTVPCLLTPRYPDLLHKTSDSGLFRATISCIMHMY